MNNKLRDIYLKYHSTYYLKENIRFELAHGNYENYYEQMENHVPMNVVENGKQRAIVLFNDIFKNSETIQVILTISQHSSKNRIQKFLFKNQFKIIDTFMTNSWYDYYEGLVTVLVIETEKKI